MVKLLKKALRLILRNRFLSLVLFCALFVAAVVFYKLVFSRPTYIYVKVKVGQGYWWANTQRPSQWFIKAIQEAKEEKQGAGEPPAKILSVAYYPYFGGGQYDVYTNLRLKVSRVGKEGKYNFERSTIGVGTPLDLEFSNVQFSGTIIQLSEKPFREQYVEKTVTLIKRNTFPWEFDSINVGDSFFNGETTTLRVISKTSSDTAVISNDSYGNYLPIDGDGQKYLTEAQKYVTVKLKLKGEMTDGQFYYGEDQSVTPGRFISLATTHFVFNDFVVARVE